MLLAYTGFTSKDNQFLDYNKKWGEDGLAYIYATNKSIENLTLRGQYVKALTDTNANGNPIFVDDYKYIDAKYAIYQWERIHILKLSMVEMLII